MRCWARKSRQSRQLKMQIKRQMLQQKAKHMKEEKCWTPQLRTYSPPSNHIRPHVGPARLRRRQAAKLIERM